MPEDLLLAITQAAARRFAKCPEEQPLPRRNFRASLEQGGVRVIAEIKRRSPSAGLLREPLDPTALAKGYEAGGAAAVSVVTEGTFFAGDPRWVAEAKKACSLPVLQKDFFHRPEHLAYGKASGADAVLLIVRILPGSLLGEMLAACRELALQALVETHNEEEMERACAAGAGIVGVNSRDLATFTTDLERAVTLLGKLPSDRLGVLESGIKSPERFRQLAAQGVRRFLIGEYLLRKPEVTGALRELVESPW